ncbi:UNVERIFIED_CONTAM: hypothetical protein Slati_1680900 [Sesamum latifolium]|uniref:Uncharacterized protein n=1 Tax=Sesamum latifolium TaxID=2727402 RepID=A0AAW2WZQ5_9LAMI
MSDCLRQQATQTDPVGRLPRCPDNTLSSLGRGSISPGEESSPPPLLQRVRLKGGEPPNGGSTSGQRNKKARETLTSWTWPWKDHRPSSPPHITPIRRSRTWWKQIEKTKST